MSCEKLEEVNIPSGVCYLGDAAFGGCAELNKITLPDTLRYMGGDPFYGTAYYKNDANWSNKVLYIGKHLIEAKSSLSGTYTVKSGTLTIGDGAFYGCEELEDVIVPESVIYIGEHALSETGYYANEDNWENGLLYLGKHLLSGDKIEEGSNVEIKNGTLTISGWAFYESPDAGEIVLPSTIKYIGSLALQPDEHPEKRIVFGGTSEEWESVWIDNENEDLWMTEVEFKTDTVTGDIDGNETIDISDAVLLFRHGLNPSLYPVDYDGEMDFTGDGLVDIADAVLLFRHSLNPGLYPIE